MVRINEHNLIAAAVRVILLGAAEGGDRHRVGKA